MSLNIETITDAGNCIVKVTGEVDVSNAAELRTVLDEVLGTGQVKVDIAEVPYIDSTGIGVLVGAAHHAGEKGGTFAVANPQRNVRRVLTLLGVDGELGVE